MLAYVRRPLVRLQTLPPVRVRLSYLLSVSRSQVKQGKRETVHAVSATNQKRITAVSCDVA